MVIRSARLASIPVAAPNTRSSTGKFVVDGKGMIRRQVTDGVDFQSLPDVRAALVKAK